ncbi:transmembrane protein 134 isoform X4 [Monodelphis domestica]|uniref:transmembrane protein 134 isoform X4 n=1 Tax=Monodelphis domestica TaxID=13616 RepID=UPI0007B40795|nr:transmembrane protein 134 isoform X4 [Monodelphis domestica]
MSGGRPEFSIDDAFELSLEEGGPGPGGGAPRFGALHFERKGRGDAEEEGEKQSRLKYQGPRALLHPEFPMVLQHHQQRHPALLPGLLQLDAAPSDPEESPGGSGLLPAAVAGPQCLQCHLLRSRLPAAHPWSVPRHLHLPGRQGPPRLPVLLLALL